MKKVLIAFALLCTGAVNAQLNTKTSTNINETSGEIELICTIFVQGSIIPKLKSDIERSMEHLHNFPCNEKIVNLNSSGGHVATAIEVGKLIRLNDYKTIVAGSNECSSACGLIFIAGIERTIEVIKRNRYLVNPKFGFHSPTRVISNNESVCITAQKDSTLVDIPFQQFQIDWYNYAIYMLGREGGINFSKTVFGVKCSDVLYASPEGLINTKIATDIKQRTM